MSAPITSHPFVPYDANRGTCKLCHFNLGTPSICHEPESAHAAPEPEPPTPWVPSHTFKWNAPVRAHDFVHDGIGDPQSGLCKAYVQSGPMTAICSRPFDAHRCVDHGCSEPFARHPAPHPYPPRPSAGPEPCPHCAKESEGLREAGVTDLEILKVPPRGTCGHEPEVDRLHEIAYRLVNVACNHKRHPLEQGCRYCIRAALEAVVEKERAKWQEALADLKEKAKGFSDADYAHAAQGGGIYFTADHIRGSAAAYADMVKHIEQAERGLEEKP